MALDLTRQAHPQGPELRLGDLALELLLQLEAVRWGVALVKRGTPKASEVIKKIDATLQAMERIFDELLDLSRASSGTLRVRAASHESGGIQ